jgi:hypothetical protein
MNENDFTFHFVGAWRSLVDCTRISRCSSVPSLRVGSELRPKIYFGQFGISWSRVKISVHESTRANIIAICYASAPCAMRVIVAPSRHMHLFLPMS